MALETKFTPLSVVVAASGATLSLPCFFNAPSHSTSPVEIPPIISDLVSLGAGILIGYFAWKTLYMSISEIRMLTGFGIMSLVGSIMGMVHFDKLPYAADPVVRSITHCQILIQFVAGVLTSVGGLKLSFPLQNKESARHGCVNNCPHANNDP